MCEWNHITYTHTYICINIVWVFLLSWMRVSSNRKYPRTGTRTCCSCICSVAHKRACVCVCAHFLNVCEPKNNTNQRESRNFFSCFCHFCCCFCCCCCPSVSLCLGDFHSITSFFLCELDSFYFLLFSLHCVVVIFGHLLPTFVFCLSP